jgi:hypothetical protein
MMRRTAGLTVLLAVIAGCEDIEDRAVAAGVEVACWFMRCEPAPSREQAAVPLLARGHTDIAWDEGPVSLYYSFGYRFRSTRPDGQLARGWVCCFEDCWIEPSPNAKDVCDPGADRNILARDLARKEKGATSADVTP